MYCPKCDMDFVDGVTVCSDCGGPLVDKDQYFKEKAAKEAEQRQKEEEEAKKAEEELKELSKARDASRSADVYVKKADQYEDLKSSSSAFRIVGLLLLVFAAVNWFNLLHTNLVFRITITVLAAGSLFIAWKADQEASGIKDQIGEEKQATEQLTEWFLTNYTPEEVDSAVRNSSETDLLPEELALKRMNYIQDVFITQYDLADQGYVDSLSEDVYARLYEADADATGENSDEAEDEVSDEAGDADAAGGSDEAEGADGNAETDSDLEAVNLDEEAPKKPE